MAVFSVLSIVTVDHGGGMHVGDLSKEQTISVLYVRQILTLNPEGCNSRRGN